MPADSPAPDQVEALQRELAAARQELATLREAALRRDEQAARLASLFVLASEGMMWVGPDSRIIQANPAAGRIWGRDPEVWRGQRWFDGFEAILRPDGSAYTADELTAFVQRVRQGPLRDYLLGLRRAGRDDAWISVNTLPVRDASGALQYTVGTTRDVTARIAAERAARESEDRFRLLAEHAQDVIYRMRLDPAPRFEYVSPAVMSWIGYTPQEHYDDPELALRATLPEDRPKLEAMLRGEIADGAPVLLRWISRDGEIVWAEHRFATERDADGNLVIEGVARNVTEQMRYQRVLRDREARLRTLFETMSEGLLVLGLDGVVLQANLAAARILRRPLERMIGQSYVGPDYAVVDAAGAHIPSREFMALVASAQGGQVSRRLLGLRDAAGQVIWLEGSAAPLAGADGQAEAMVLVFSDVTARVEAERELRQHRDQLEDLVSARTLAMRLANARLAAESAERRRAEEDARRSERFLRQVIDATPNIIFCKDREGRYLLVNQALADLFGLPTTEVEGRSYAEIVERLRLDPALLRESQHSDSLALSGAQGEVRYELTFPTPHSQPRLFDVIKLALRPPQAIGDEDGAAPDYILGVGVDITATRRAEQTLRESEAQARDSEAQARESEARYHALFDGSADAIFVETLDGRILDCNAAACELYGYAKEELLRLSVEDLVTSETREPLRAVTPEQEGSSPYGSFTGRRSDGALFPGEVSVKSIILDGQPSVLAYVRDMTDRRRLEEQLRQAAKMEAVGRLAGGVAHDFNNLLTVINGYSEMALGSLDAQDPLHGELSEILQAGQRAADLTQRLLAFSRQQVVELKIIHLNHVLDDDAKMLRRIIGEQIALEMRLAPDLGRIRADRGQIEQLALNLAVNARDAILARSPEGGRVIIRTANVTRSESDVSPYLAAAPGRYVRLSVSDTGVGMAPDVLARLFEPFYTTKEVGKGTGLGLAVVYGVVRECGGAIEVESAPGQGATFHIDLPLVEESPEEKTPSGARTRLPGGDEMILIVEDQPDVRRLLGQMLRRLGYRVVEASGGAEALGICTQSELPIRLVITDVVMPGMSGAQFAARLRQSRPELRLLFASGYADDTLRDHIGDSVALDDIALIAKPFQLDALAREVRRALG